MSDSNQQPDLVERDDNDPKWFMTTVVAIAGSLIVVATVYLVSAIYYGVEDNRTRVLMVEVERQDLAEYRQQMNASLNGGGEFPSVDDKKSRPGLATVTRRAGITIDKAKEVWLKLNGK